MALLQNVNYTIIESHWIAKTENNCRYGICYGYNEKNDMWVTWIITQVSSNEYRFDLGHYFCHKTECMKDYYNRIINEFRILATYYRKEN